MKSCIVPLQTTLETPEFHKFTKSEGVNLQIATYLFGNVDIFRQYRRKNMSNFSQEALDQMRREKGNLVFKGEPSAIPRAKYKQYTKLNIDEDGNIVRRKDGKIDFLDEDGKSIEYENLKDLFDTTDEVSIHEFKDGSYGWLFKPAWYSELEFFMYGLAKEIEESHNLPQVFRTTLAAHIRNFMDSGEFSSKTFDYGLIDLLDDGNASIWSLYMMVDPDLVYKLHDQAYVENLLGTTFVEPKRFTSNQFRRFSETAAVLGGRRLLGEYTVLDALSPGQQKVVLGTKAEDGHEYTAKIFRRMPWSEQVKVVNDILANADRDNLNSRDAFRAYIKHVVLGNGVSNVSKWFSKILLPARYTLAMSFSGGLSGFLQLLTINSTMYLSDMLGDGIKKTLKGNLFEVVRKHAISEISIQDARLNNGAIETIADNINGAAEKLRQSFRAGPFNVGDMFREKSIYAIKYNDFFRQFFPYANTREEVDVALTNLMIKDHEQYEAIIDRANTYVEATVRMNSTNTPWISKNTPVYYANSKDAQAGLEIYLRMYNFMAGRGRAKFKGYIQNIKNVGSALNTDIAARYLEAIRMGEDADEVLRILTLQNRDAHDFITKSIMALKLGVLIERYGDHDKADPDDMWTRFKDIGSFAGRFNGDWNAITTLPEFKIMQGFFEAAIHDFDGDGDTDFHMLPGSANAVTTAVKSFLRGVWFWSGVYGGAVKSDGIDINTIAEEVLNNTRGFLYYSKDNIELAGADEYVSKIPIDELLSLAGVKDRDFATRDEAKARLTYARLIDDPGGFANFFLNRVPFARHKRMANMPDTTELDKALSSWYTSEQYNIIAKKEWHKLTQDQLTFVYEQMDKIGGDAADSIDPNNAFLKSYTFLTDDGKLIAWQSAQVRENVFNLLMKKGIEKESLQYLEQIFSDREIKGYEVSAARTLAYIKAKSPGSAAVVLQYLMNGEYFDAMTSTFGWNKEEWKYIPDSRSNQKKAEIAAKYMPYIDIAERHTVLPQLGLKIAKDSNHEISKYISAGGDTLRSSLGIKLPEQEFTNSKYYQAFKTNVLINTLTLEGELDAYKMRTIFSNMFKHSLEDKDESTGVLDKNFINRTLQHMSMTMDDIDDMRISDKDKLVMKTGLLLSADKYMDAAAKDPSFGTKHSAELQNLFRHLRATTNQLDEAIVEDAEDRAEGVLRGSSGRSHWFTKINYREPELVRRMKRMTQRFATDRDYLYQHKKDYDNKKYYNKDELAGILISKKGRGASNIGPFRSNNNTRYDRLSNKPGGGTYHRQGRARPKGAKTEDPDKPVDFTSAGRVKRVRKRLPKPKEESQFWRRVNKLGGTTDPTKFRRQRSRKT